MYITFLVAAYYPKPQTHTGPLKGPPEFPSEFPLEAPSISPIADGSPDRHNMNFPHYQRTRHGLIRPQKFQEIDNCHLKWYNFVVVDFSSLQCLCLNLKKSTLLACIGAKESTKKLRFHAPQSLYTWIQYEEQSYFSHFLLLLRTTSPK